MMKVVRLGLYSWVSPMHLTVSDMDLLIAKLHEYDFFLEALTPIID